MTNESREGGAGSQETDHSIQKSERGQPLGRRRRAAQRARALAERKADAMPVVQAVGPTEERYVDAALADPSPKGGLLETMRQPYVLYLVVQRELAQMYSASILGLLWSYVQPAVRFATYYFVMGVILHQHRNVPFFAVHLFSGMVFVHFFTECFHGGTRSIWQNRALVIKMAMPREIFPVASIVVALYHTLPQVLLLALICLANGWRPDPVGIYAGILGTALVGLFSMATALLFSAFNVFYRDFQNIVGTITQFLHFMVPMMYPIQKVLQQAKAQPLMVHLYLLNPLSEAVMLVQRFFWYPVALRDVRQSPTQNAGALIFPQHFYSTGWIMLIASAVYLVVAQSAFRKMENKFPERL